MSRQPKDKKTEDNMSLRSGASGKSKRSNPRIPLFEQQQSNPHPSPPPQKRKGYEPYFRNPSTKKLYKQEFERLKDEKGSKIETEELKLTAALTTISRLEYQVQALTNTNREQSEILTESVRQTQQLKRNGRKDMENTLDLEKKLKQAQARILELELQKNQIRGLVTNIQSSMANSKIGFLVRLAIIGLLFDLVINFFWKLTERIYETHFRRRAIEAAQTWMKGFICVGVVALFFAMGWIMVWSASYLLYGRTQSMVRRLIQRNQSLIQERNSSSTQKFAQFQKIYCGTGDNYHCINGRFYETRKNDPIVTTEFIKWRDTHDL